MIEKLQTEEKQLFAERFKSARLMSGYSLQDLANILDGMLSRQALHRYEKGEVIPDMDKLNIIAKALKVNADFFSRSTQIKLGKIEYRKLSKLPQKEETAIAEITKEYLSSYLELEEIIGLSNDFINPLKDFEEISSYEQVNKAAEIVREYWGIGKGSIFNVVELLEDNKIKVVKLEVAEDFDGLQTMVTYNNLNLPVIAYNSKKTNKPDRIRFTLLHELAHLLLKFKSTLTERQIETRCSQFAGAMLLPEKTLQEELGKFRNKISFTELGNIKKQYGISMQAIIMRAKDCGIINEHYTKQLFFMFTQMNWRVDEPYDYVGVEHSSRFEQLLFRALIEDQVNIAKAASLTNKSVEDFKKEHLPFL